MSLSHFVQLFITTISNSISMGITASEVASWEEKQNIRWKKISDIPLKVWGFDNNNSRVDVIRKLYLSPIKLVVVRHYQGK